MAADEGQRKLAAILAADVVGCSRPMADDERATVAALEDARAVFGNRINAHGDRLVDTAGDSIPAEFRSVVEAVEFPHWRQKLRDTGPRSRSTHD